MTGRITPAQTGPLALVAGGSSGIGLAIAHALAARGFDLLIAARDAARLADAAAQLRTRHHGAVDTLSADLSTAAGRAAVAVAAADSRVGVVVSGAGVPHPGRFIEGDLQAYRDTTALKTLGTLEVAHAAATGMAERGRGAILLISSTGALKGVPHVGVNSATEAYVLNLGEALHEELTSRGVTVTTLMPGPTNTPAMRRMLPTSQHPRGVMTPEAVAAEALHALDRARPTHIAGTANRITNRLLPRRLGTLLMGAMTARLLERRATATV